MFPELLSSTGAVELDGEATVALTATFTVDGSVLAREVEFVMLLAFFIFLIYSSFNYCETSV